MAVGLAPPAGGVFDDGKTNPSGGKTVSSFVFNKQFDTAVDATENVVAVSRMFGVGLDESRRFTVFADFNLEIKPGEITFITGQSGGGKTLLLQAIKKHLAAEGSCVDLADVPRQTGKPLVDSFGDGADSLERALRALSIAGLADAYLFLRRPCELSAGQQYRFRLARALALVIDYGGAIVIDEFCSNLDRITARIIAANCRKFADRYGVTIVAASAHDDLVEDLQPDQLIEKLYGNRVKVSRPTKSEVTK